MDRHAAQLQEAIHRALIAYSDSAPVDALESAYAAGAKPERIVALFDAHALHDAVTTAVVVAGQAAADTAHATANAHIEQVEGTERRTAAMSATDVALNAIANSTAAAVVTNVTDGLRVVSAMFGRRRSPAGTAAAATKAAAGLAARSATAIANRFLANTPPTTKDAANGAAAAAKQKQNYARAVADTTSASVVNGTAARAWSNYLTDLGVADQFVLVWTVVDDDRLCDLCAPLDGQTAPVGGTFDTDIGPVSGPPLHAYCRCVTQPQRR